jgi:hypothetical protein
VGQWDRRVKMQRFIDFTVDTGTSYDLTTAAIVSAALGITNDAALAARVTAYSKMIADLCDRPFVQQNVTESFRISTFEDPRAELKLDRWPVQEIISITENDQVLDPAEYEFNKENGLVWKVSFGWWGFCSGLTVVDYISGYDLPDGAPPSLALACTEWIRAVHFTSTRDPTIRSIQHGDRQVTYGDFYNRFGLQGSGDTALPPNVAGLIDPYRRKVLGG